MRLIDADALDNAFTRLRFNADGEIAHWGDRKDWCLHGSEVETLIANAPTVDAEPVVRCMECKWKELCQKTLEYKGADGYCSRGERRDEDETHD